MILYLLLKFLGLVKPRRRRKKRAVTVTIKTSQRKQPAQDPSKLRRDSERERARAERAERLEEKRAAQVEQAELDAPFYESQLDDYTRLHRDAQRLYEAAQSEVDKDVELNKYGAVVSIKTYSKHIAARDRYKKAVLMYERQIHAAQKNLDKARRILDNDKQ